MTRSPSHISGGWPETRAAFSRVAASWRDLQAARREARDTDKLIRARRLVLRALAIHPDALNPYAERIAERAFDALHSRGLIDMQAAARASNTPSDSLDGDGA